MKKKIFGLILCVAIMACIGVTGATGAFAYDKTIEEWGVEHFNQLDVGIYWYTEIDQKIPVKDYEFDKSKPTIIYTHGWKPTDAHVREGLSLKDQTDPAMANKGYKSYAEEGYDPEFYNYYLKQGYNVGVFYWNQLSGGEITFSFDSKIWWSDNGRNMTYYTYDKVDAQNKDGKCTKSDDPTNPKESVALLYAHELIEKLGKDYNKDLHLVGHSMGGQLTLAVGEALCLMKDAGEIERAFLPDRLTLCDPYLNFITSITGTIDHTKKYVKNVNTAYLSAQAAATCANHAIPIEAFGVNESMVFRNYFMLASGADKDDPEYVTAMETTKMLGDNCAWVYMKSMAGNKGYGDFDPTHVMSVDYYFSTNYMDSMVSKEGLKVPSAKMTNEELQETIGRCFVQYIDDGSNPMYYNSGYYQLENFYSQKISPYTEEDGIGYIRGKIEVSHRNGKDVEVKLVDENNKTVAEAYVNEDGYYHFSNVQAGNYSIKIYADTIKVDEIENVSVVKDSIKQVTPETKEIIMGGDKLLLYAVIALCSVVGLVCLAGLIKAIVFAVKKNAAKK